jgi:hypothetical protein
MCCFMQKLILQRCPQETSIFSEHWECHDRPVLRGLRWKDSVSNCVPWHKELDELAD